MNESGLYNKAYGADRFGFEELAAVHWNLQAPRLYCEAIQRFEARIAAGGALVAETGEHTGRSPKDKFIVRDATTDRAVSNPLPLPLRLLRQPPPALDHPMPRRALLGPGQRLRGGIDLVVVAGVGEQHELGEVVGQPMGGFGEVDEADFDRRGLRVEAHDLVAVGRVARDL